MSGNPYSETAGRTRPHPVKHKGRQPESVTALVSGSLSRRSLHTREQNDAHDDGDDDQHLARGLGIQNALPSRRQTGKCRLVLRMNRECVMPDGHDLLILMQQLTDY
jgi:hypothetical protein